tara:strand:- start:190 stop:2016 length:1827 start_codon:yes stop_codon:yes gene_type:complete
MIYKITLILVTVIEFCLSQVRIPAYETHDRGELWDTMNDDGTHGSYPQRVGEFKPSMDWPAGPKIFNGPYEQRSYMYKAGVWTGGTLNGEIFLTKNGPLEIDLESIYNGIQKEQNYIESENFLYNEPEEKILASWVTPENIKIERISKSWSFRGYNNFIIISYNIKNLNQVEIDDFFFGSVFLLRPSSQDFNSHAGWNDALSRADDVVGIDIDEKMIYARDGTGAYDFNAGVGNWSDGNLLTHGFAGFAALNAPICKNGLDQPQRYFISNYIINQSLFQLSNQSEQFLYEILSGVNTSFNSVSGDTIDPIAIMSFGPYKLGSDEAITIDIVESVNGLNYSEVINLDQGDMNEIQNRYINEGLDSLKASIQNARTLFQNDYLLNQYPPPSPQNVELLASPASQSISVIWEPIENSYSNPLTGRKNIEKYIIYKSDSRFIGPYDIAKNRIRVHKDFDKNAYFNEQDSKWEYSDSDISLGVSYYYAVTSVDSTGKESWLTNRNETPLQAISAPKDNISEIKVFPNPFKITSGIPTVGQENTISWTNLPSPCKISIYTSNGKLIKNISHSGNTGDATWDQRTNSRLIASPGIYFWAVESNFGNSTGTLVIIK